MTVLLIVYDFKNTPVFVLSPERPALLGNGRLVSTAYEPHCPCSWWPLGEADNYGTFVGSYSITPTGPSRRRADELCSSRNPAGVRGGGGGNSGRCRYYSEKNEYQNNHKNCLLTHLFSPYNKS